jgi:hypothetical protein
MSRSDNAPAAGRQNIGIKASRNDSDSDHYHYHYHYHYH